MVRVMRFYDVTLTFRIGVQLVQPTIKHIPALDEKDAFFKALATSTATSARERGADVTVLRVQESD